MAPQCRGSTLGSTSGLELLNLQANQVRQKEAKNALDVLCQDTCKKIRHRQLELAVNAANQQNAREAAAGVDRAADRTLVDYVGASIVDVGNGPSVLVYIIDPSDNACYTATNADPGAVAPQPVRWGKWDLTGKYRACFIIPTKSLEEVYKGVKSKIPAGRSIRAIYGCMVLLRPGVVVNPNADIERLTTDAEFAAFLQDMASKPIALQVVLKHNG
ncbi:hypothetical protein BDZ91DRAFT_766450 [Kalaharituber pfeilii]|nr:hypothetical protein BDZ91DRAFT_766450 [Kalaharituber pfeilii]